jgi:hypothetical protein
LRDHSGKPGVAGAVAGGVHFEAADGVEKFSGRGH